MVCLMQGGISGTVHGKTLAAMTPHAMRFSMNQIGKIQENWLALKRRNLRTGNSEFTPEDAIRELKSS